MMGSWFIKQCDSPHIGDWIMLDIGKGITRIRKPGRVIAIDSTTITIEDEDGNRYTNVRSCFHPIEIDEEFLLANGFQIERKIQPNVVRYIRSGFHVAFIVLSRFGNNKYYMLMPAATNPRTVGRVLRGDGAGVHISYVHELQHYLMWLDNKRFFNLKLTKEHEVDVDCKESLDTWRDFWRDTSFYVEKDDRIAEVIHKNPTTPVVVVHKTK